MSTANDLVELIGHDAAQRLIDAYGGEMMYIPGSIGIDASEVRLRFDELMYDGARPMAAYDQVAHDYGVSARTVMRIVANF